MTEKEKKKKLEKSLDDLRFDCEMRLVNACMKAEKLVKGPYKCTCPDPYKWNKEECEKFLKEKTLDELVEEAQKMGMYE